MYHRVDCMVLGDTTIPSEDTKDDVNEDISRCFNCGDPDHKVSGCQLPANRDLIALSRQYHQFFHGNLPQWKRFHSVEAWRQQRLDWLETYEPGQIRGDLLRSALADSKEEWLKNICAWGYPPGWISADDPQERVRARIWQENDADTDSLDMFKIFGDDDAIEEVLFCPGTPENGEATQEGRRRIVDENDILLPDQPLTNSSQCNTRSKRWAKYPNSYFSSDFLVPYIPPIPSSPSPAWDDTSFTDTYAYLQQGTPYYNR